MDNLKSLLDKGEYQLVIDLTENSIDLKGLLYRIDAFSKLGKFNEVVETIENNRKVLELSPINLIDTHIGALVQLEQFEKAYKEAEHYKELPYISQEVEEYIHELPNLIREAEKEILRRNKNSIEDVKLVLDTSKDNEDLLNALDKSRNMDRDIFAKCYIDLCTNKNRDIHQFVRTFSLMILVDMKFDKDISFIKHDEIIDVNPSKLFTPYENEHYKQIVNKISNSLRNPSITNAAIKLLADYIFDRYPYDALLENDNDLLIAVFISIANSYFSNSEDLSKLYIDLNVSQSEIDELKNKIELDLKKTNELKF